MIGKIAGIGIVLIVSFAVFQIFMSTTPARAIYLRIPEVAGINDSCIYNNIVDVVDENRETIFNEDGTPMQTTIHDNYFNG